MTPTPAPLPRGPFVLLGLMTATTVLGPFLIGMVLRGGESQVWPPDRSVEWVTVLGTSAAVLGLMAACLSLGFRHRRAISGATARSRTGANHTAPAEVEP